MSQGLKQGSTLYNGNYRIERVLGQGGFGITYLAVDLNLDRMVAIKEFFPKDYCDREGSTSHVTLGTKHTGEFVNKLKAKFLKEARNIAKFDHPGIIKIYSAFEDNNTAYYVMEYIDGESLSDKVKRDGPIDENEALRYIIKIGSALNYVHSRQINHLDVKPGNIMVRKSDNEPILIDFGLSKQYDTEGHETSTTPTGISHGYAPMEQYSEGGVKEFSPQTDLYSLAATLYYLLSGTIPPQASRLIDEKLTFPSVISGNLRWPIEKAMSSARRNRQETVAKFLDDLEGDSTTDIVSSPAGPTEINVSNSTGGASNQPRPLKKDGTHGNQEKLQPEIKTKSSSLVKKICIAASILVVTAVLVFVFFPGSGTANDEGKDSLTLNPGIGEKAANSPKTVEAVFYESSLGPCSYTGEVDADGKPHGNGKAEWSSGLGKSYDGEWVHGEMSGNAVYLSNSGFRFEGEFKSGHYHQGKLITPEGDYYIGTFDDNGKKWTGTEYYKNGEEAATWVNGE